jgi:probable rRNA maturation factor
MPVEIFFRKNCGVRISTLRRGIEAVLSYSRKSKAQIEISLVGESKIRRLNRQWRNKDKVTDVLSFPIQLKAPPGKVPWILGEILIAMPVARRQAKQAGRSVTAQVLRLSLHGLVHLEGLDHDKSRAEKIIFEKKEIKYLKYLNQKGLIQWDGSLQF